MENQNKLTGNEEFFDENEIIVSKTDLKGIVTYANDIFLDVAGYKEKEIIGKPHNIIRNPFMPKAIFKLLWEKVKSGNEIFAYVVNRCKNGDYYWVLAHVTPSFDGKGNVVGYHSNRRVPNRKVLEDVIIPLYEKLKTIENNASNKKQGMEESYKHLMELVKEHNMTYEEYIFHLNHKFS